MKKLTVLSMIAASLLFVGCGDSATGAEAKSATETKPAHEAAAKCAADGKCGAGKCGDAKKSPATEAKEAASHAVEKAKEAVAEKATAVVDAAKEKASAAVESTKEAATAVVAAATEAVASATGPDGKALFAKCMGCHGADGGNKPMGKDAVMKGQTAEALTTKMEGYKAGTLNAHGMGGLMKGQVSKLSTEEIKAIAAYIAK